MAFVGFCNDPMDSKIMFVEEIHEFVSLVHLLLEQTFLREHIANTYFQIS